MKSAEANAPSVAPISFTDQTSGAVVGIGCRKSLERTLKRLECPHVKSGNRIIVLCSDWEASIRRAAGTQSTPKALSDDTVIALASRRGR